jgi:hypothetical protein
VGEPILSRHVGFPPSAAPHRTAGSRSPTAHSHGRGTCGCHATVEARVHASSVSMRSARLMCRSSSSVCDLRLASSCFSRRACSANSCAHATHPAHVLQRRYTSAGDGCACEGTCEGAALSGSVAECSSCVERAPQVALDSPLLACSGAHVSPPQRQRACRCVAPSASTPAEVCFSLRLARRVCASVCEGGKHLLVGPGQAVHGAPHGEHGWV